MFTLPVLASGSLVLGKTCDSTASRWDAGGVGCGVKQGERGYPRPHTWRPWRIDCIRAGGGGLSQELVGPRGAGQVGAHCPPLAVLKSFLPAPRPHPKVLAELALGRCPLRKPAPKRGAGGTWGPSTPTCLCKWGLWGPVRGGVPQQSLVCKGLNLGLGYAEERVTKHTALWSDHLGRSPGTCPVTWASRPPRRPQDS